MSQSTTTKQPTMDETISGLSLHRLGPLNSNRFSLNKANHDRSWADNLISSNGPTDREGWTSAYISIYDTIEDENIALAFLDRAYLSRALCVALFLYKTSIGGTSEKCPKSAMLKDTSGHGGSGRPDRTYSYHDKVVCVVEGKTSTVCTVGNQQQKRDILSHISHYAENWVPTGLADDDQLGLTLVGTWHKKAKSIIYQVSILLCYGWISYRYKMVGMASVVDQECRTYRDRQSIQFLARAPHRQ